MNTKHVMDYLSAQGFGTPGVDLFRDNMPAKVTKGILVTNQTLTRRNAYVQNYMSGVFEITARAKTFDEVRETMNSVSDAISGQGQVMGDLKFLIISPANDPLVYPVSDADHVEASVLFNFRLIRI